MNIIPAYKRSHPSIDFGYVGDFETTEINKKGLEALMKMGVTPVICALTHDKQGSLLNTNADTMAAGIASALSGSFSTELHLCFEKRGVLRNPDDDASVIDRITRDEFTRLKDEGGIHSGMIPKLQNGFTALANGVEKVMIRHALFKDGTTLE